MKNKGHSKDNWRQRYLGKRKRKSIFRNRFFWLFVIIFIVLAGLFYFFLFSPVFQIKKISVQGTFLTNPSEVEEIVGRMAERKILFFTFRSIFVFNKEQARQLILERFLAIDNVIFQKKLPYHLAVRVEERRPRIMFCPLASDSLVDSSSLKEVREKRENCFLVDKQGLAFYTANQDLITNPAIMVFSEIDQAELAKTVIPKEVLEFIVWADYKLQGKVKMAISEFIVSSSKVEARTDAGMAIYFDSQKDLNRQIEDLMLVLENEIFSQKEKGLSQQEIEYIDLRFDKVFYK